MHVSKITKIGFQHETESKTINRKIEIKMGKTGWGGLGARRPTELGKVWWIGTTLR
jgi:hypothetical protein